MAGGAGRTGVGHGLHPHWPWRGELGSHLSLLPCRDPVCRSDFRRQDRVQPHSLTWLVGLAPFLRTGFSVFYLNPPKSMQNFHGIFFLEKQGCFPTSVRADPLNLGDI